MSTTTPTLAPLSLLLAQQQDLLAQLNTTMASTTPAAREPMATECLALPPLPSGLTREQELAEAYWATREFKVYAVTVLARRRYEPDWERTYFARARTPAGAIRATKAHMFESPPTTPHFTARLATPRQLGCVPS
ncbi:hypothetical protein LNV47_22560 [Paucibacter sp. DJ4R-1]|nr:hypothetical protein [Paucibacter sp. DJ4R-1]